MEKEIMDFYENVKPDEKARKRMLKNIQALAAQEEAEGKEGNNMKLKSRKMARVAVAASAALSILTAGCAVGYAAGLFNLDDTGIGKKILENPESGQEYQVDIISLQGLSDSPEYKACKEWSEFTLEYDKDETISSKVGNKLAGFGDYEEAYGCYSQEMADKVDEICNKYQLTRLSGLKVANNAEELCSQLGISNIYKLENKDIQHSSCCGYSYANGTFHVDGTAVFKNDEGKEAGYQLTHSVKGFFDTTTLNVGDFENYRQWEYTTKSGKTVLLAKGSSKALILAETDSSFITVNVLGDMEQDTFGLSNKELEMLAESFDFSEIS